MKKLLSIVLALSMVLSVCVFTVPVASAAEEAWNGSAALSFSGGGTGVSTDPYKIGTAEELKLFANIVNGFDLSEGFGHNPAACAVLTADIVLNSGELTNDYFCEPLYNGEAVSDTNMPQSWFPIAYKTGSNDFVYYNGTFDGAGHTISGLFFNTTQSNIGLFGIIDTEAEISNVGIVNSYMSGNTKVGAIVGYTRGGKITNCYNTGFLRGSGGYDAGGICGYNTSECIITGCYNTGTIKGSYQIGGICGVNDGTVTYCYNTGNIDTDQFYDGGIIGYNRGTVTFCYSTGAVSGSYYYYAVAGINNGTIENCYYLKNATINPKKTGTNAADADGFIAPLDDDGLADAQNFTNWVFTDTWVMHPTLGRPVLEAIKEGEAGTKDDPYKISTASQLKLFNDILNGLNGQAANPSACAELTADIIYDIGDLTIPMGSILSIPEGVTLTVAEGCTLTNNGAIKKDGELVINGTFTGNSALYSTSYMDAEVDQNGKVTLSEKQEYPSVLTAEPVTWGAADGEEHWYVLDKDLTIANRITVVGDVYLILADECTLTATQGISVSTGNSLTIYGQTAGTGKLNAGTTAWRSSIGGAHGGSLGTLVINGGVITADATASYYVNENNQKGSGAGIGNGFASTSDVGTLTVNNGTVTAIGGLYGAGIGGGLSGDGVNVIIRGGTVTAQGNSAADIGRGSSGKKNGSFSTGASGTAFIVADSISDTSAQSSWNCLIASKDKKNYSAYGDVTLTQSLTIPTDGALTVSTGGMLTIPYTYTVTNNGTLNNNGVVRIATRRLYLTRDDGAMPVIGVDYQYKSPANLVITSSEPMTVYGTGTQAADCLAVAAGITANLTLNNVYIHVTGRSPFSIPSVTGETTKVNLTLVGKNTLRAGSEDYAGLQTSMNAVLTISGTGSLNATGNTYAAGIGGGNCGSDTVTGEPTGTPEHDTAHGGTIIIRGGTINATGGQYGAGIGDGDYRGDKTPATSASVTISGGIVTATSIGKGSDYTAATPGTFSTGENGGAIISVESISNTSNSADWNYIALSSDGLSYTVNGNVSLKQNLTIPKGSTLTIPEGTALNVTEGYTLANLGTATGAGGLTGSGVITGISETLSGSLTSFGDASADMTVELWQGNTKIDTLTSTSNYSFAGVTPGAYTLKVTKAGHVTERFTVNVAVADILKNVKLYLIGDINGDSVCDVLDCMLAERVLSKQSTPSTDDYKYYDLNEDGTCDIDDYQNVVNAALSL